MAPCSRWKKSQNLNFRKEEEVLLNAKTGGRPGLGSPSQPGGGAGPALLLCLGHLRPGGHLRDILGTSSCSSLESVPQALRGHTACILVHPRASLVHPRASSTRIPRASSCIPRASSCIPRASSCIPRASSCILVHPRASSCILDEDSSCILVHPRAGGDTLEAE